MSTMIETRTRAMPGDGAEGLLPLHPRRGWRSPDATVGNDRQAFGKHLEQAYGNGSSASSASATTSSGDRDSEAPARSATVVPATAGSGGSAAPARVKDGQGGGPDVAAADASAVGATKVRPTDVNSADAVPSDAAPPGDAATSTAVVTDVAGWGDQGKLVEQASGEAASAVAEMSGGSALPDSATPVAASGAAAVSGEAGAVGEPLSDLSTDEGNPSSLSDARTVVSDLHGALPVDGEDGASDELSGSVSAAVAGQPSGSAPTGDGERSGQSIESATAAGAARDGTAVRVDDDHLPGDSLAESKVAEASGLPSAVVAPAARAGTAEAPAAVTPPSMPTASRSSDGHSARRAAADNATRSVAESLRIGEGQADAPRVGETVDARLAARSPGASGAGAPTAAALGAAQGAALGAGQVAGPGVAQVAAAGVMAGTDAPGVADAQVTAATLRRESAAAGIAMGKEAAMEGRAPDASPDRAVDPLALTGRSRISPVLLDGPAIESTLDSRPGSSPVAGALSFGARLESLLPMSIAPRSVPLGATAGGGSHGAGAAELAEGVRWTLAEGRGQAWLNVSPAGLGPVSIRVSVEAEQVTVAIAASHPGARDALESLVPRLREQLLADGHAEVQVDISSGDDSRRFAAADDRADGRSGTGHAMEEADDRGSSSAGGDPANTSRGSGVHAPDRALIDAWA